MTIDKVEELIKGTVSVILTEHQSKDDNVRFKTVLLKDLTDQV